MGEIGFTILNPVQVVIRPNQKLRINLGVKASIGLLPWVREREIGGVCTSLSFFPPGFETWIEVYNDSSVPITLVDGQPLLNVLPLSWSGNVIVE
jgi:hypothetical protein